MLCVKELPLAFGVPLQLEARICCLHGVLLSQTKACASSKPSVTPECLWATVHVDCPFQGTTSDFTCAWHNWMSGLCFTRSHCDSSSDVRPAQFSLFAAEIAIGRSCLPTREGLCSTSAIFSEPGFTHQRVTASYITHVTCNRGLVSTVRLSQYIKQYRGIIVRIQKPSAMLHLELNKLPETHRNSRCHTRRVKYPFRRLSVATARFV